MTNKQLSPDQIQALFKFMRQKYVDYYDVQIELVDHFACAIEDIWKERPNTTFEQATQQIYNRFPLTGFYQLIDKKRKALVKRIKSHTWKHVKEFLRLPKIMATLLAVVIGYIFFSYVPRPTWFAYLIMVIATGRIFYLLNGLNATTYRKKFLVLETLQNSQVGFSFIIYVPHFFLEETGTLPPWMLIGLSCITVLFILISIGHYKVATSIYSDWQRQFPKYV